MEHYDFLALFLGLVAGLILGWILSNFFRNVLIRSEMRIEEEKTKICEFITSMKTVLANEGPERVKASVKEFLNEIWLFSSESFQRTGIPELSEVARMKNLYDYRVMGPMIADATGNVVAMPEYSLQMIDYKETEDQIYNGFLKAIGIS